MGLGGEAGRCGSTATMMSEHSATSNNQLHPVVSTAHYDDFSFFFAGLSPAGLFLPFELPPSIVLSVRFFWTRTRARFVSPSVNVVMSK